MRFALHDTQTLRPIAVMPVTITVMQDKVQEKLTVSDAVSLHTLGTAVSAWEHHSKFKFYPELAESTTLIIDDLEHTWKSLAEHFDVPISTLADGAESVVLILSSPPPLVAALPLVGALDEVLEPLSVPINATVGEMKALIETTFEGAVCDVLVQTRGLDGVTFASVKLSVFNEPSVTLVAALAKRLAKVPEMLRPPVPTDISQLRLKLAIGMALKADAPTADAPPAHTPPDDQFAQKTRAKVIHPSALARCHLGTLPSGIRVESTP